VCGGLAETRCHGKAGEIPPQANPIAGQTREGEGKTRGGGWRRGAAGAGRWRGLLHLRESRGNPKNAGKDDYVGGEREKRREPFLGNRYTSAVGEEAVPEGMNSDNLRAGGAQGTTAYEKEKERVGSFAQIVKRAALGVGAREYGRWEKTIDSKKGTLKKALRKKLGTAQISKGN